MDYFLSGGTISTGVISTGAIPTITTIPEVATNPTMHVSSFIGDSLYQIIPSELLSFVDRPFVLTIFVRVLVIIWVLKDSTYRSSSTSFCLFSLLLVTIGTPILGLPIYLAIRPLGYKHERNYWKTAISAIENSAPTESKDTAEIDDEEHLADLKQKATLAQKRVKKVATKKPTTRRTTRKVATKTPATTTKTTSTATKTPTTPKKIPTPKKAITRTAQ